MLTLSIFPGIDLLGTAFELEGFCVVRGPDRLWGGDIKVFHPPARRFDGVIGGPPCQAHSRLAHLVRANGYEVAEDLIPEFERVVGEAAPAWFLMENTEAAPSPVVAGYRVQSLLFNNRWTGAEQNRLRRFSFGSPDGLPLDMSPEQVALENPLWSPAITASGGRRVCVKRGGSGKLKSTYQVKYNAVTFEESCRLQGLPAGFDLPGFTAQGKAAAVGNGVPLFMGRAIARSVRRALGLPILTAEEKAS